MEFNISAQERARGHLNSENIGKALTALRQDGYVILHEAIDKSQIADLSKQMLTDVKKILALEVVPFQFRNGHLQQDPPPFSPFLFRDILVNPFVIDLTEALLGKGVKNAFYSGNCCLPNNQRQPVHFDTGHLWPDLLTVHPAHALVINIPVVDMTIQNGSTELWPTSHLNTARSLKPENIKIPEQALEKQRALCPPLQPHLPIGSILIRDMRLWHCGMPNHTDRPRPMIAMIHYPIWYHTKNPIRFSREAEKILSDDRLTTIAEFVDGPIDYIGRHAEYDYKP